MIQFPVLVFLFKGLDADVLVFAAALSYPALIYSEKFISGRVTAGKTYKVMFVSNNPKKDHCILKIRNSRIICNDYIYTLPFDFRKTILGDDIKSLTLNHSEGM